MRTFHLHALFAAGLAARLGLIFVAAPPPVMDWYAPFMDATTGRFTTDPWALWLASGGDALAFPYGYAMWLAFLPATVLAKLLALQTAAGYAATLLAADAALLVTLRHLFPERRNDLLVAYWLSPVVILANYGLGLNDVIPVLFLVWSIHLVRRQRWCSAGAVCMTAISAKLSMIIAVPFVAIYLYRDTELRRRGLRRFTAGFALAAMLFAVPFAMSDGVDMLVHNPEMAKIYALVVHLGGGVSIYVVPVVYLVSLYLVWRIRRFNFNIFLSATGLAFLTVVLFTAGSPGWFLWTVPFLAYYSITHGRVTAALVASFSAAYVLSTLLFSPVHTSGGYVFDLREAVPSAVQTGVHMSSLVHTGMVGIGVVLAIRIWREAIRRNDFFRFTRKPFVIGISGDSGVGKDHLADALTGLLGRSSVTRLSGDDYHLWDRNRPMWKAMTHLNPAANDLERFGDDLVSLTNRKSIFSRHYNHQTGKNGPVAVVRSNDFIIASGLHALYFPVVRECCNLGIYLDMDDKLRSSFKLRRDVRDRGHAIDQAAAAIAKRKIDSGRFIRPQRAHADLILTVLPVGEVSAQESDERPRAEEARSERSGRGRIVRRCEKLKLAVRTRRSSNELLLTRMLIGVCGLRVDISIGDERAERVLTVEGEVAGDDMELISRTLCPSVLEFLALCPAWEDGITGLMQLIVLCHIDQELRRSIIER